MKKRLAVISAICVCLGILLISWFFVKEAKGETQNFMFEGIILHSCNKIEIKDKEIIIYSGSDDKKTIYLPDNMINPSISKFVISYELEGEWSDKEPD